MLNRELTQPLDSGNSKEHIEGGEGTEGKGWRGKDGGERTEGKGRREKDLNELLEARGGALRVIFCVGICPSFGNNTLNGSGF